VITAVGAGVANLQPGVAVFGLAAGSLGSHVLSVADALVQLHISTVDNAVTCFNRYTVTVYMSVLCSCGLLPC